MREITGNIQQIDTLAFGHERLIAAYLVKGKEKTALIDPGFPASAEVLLGEMRGQGMDPAKLDYILLTHFHIDHSGGTGALLKAAPQAKVIVHKRAAFYVKNFGKIVGGARMVFKQELIRRFGDAYPVPAEKVVSVIDGDTIDLGGGTRLRVIHAPGHCPDNVAFFEEETASLFTGDLACLQYPDLNGVPIPAGSPPLFDLGEEIHSLRAVEKIAADRVLAPHFGVIASSCGEFVEKSIAAIEETKKEIQGMFGEGIEFQHMIERLRKRILESSGVPEEKVPEFLSGVYLREMLKTGLMGFLAYMLEYAPYPRAFSPDACELTGAGRPADGG